MMDFGWANNMSGFVWVFMILFWALIIMGIVYLLRNFTNNNDKNNNNGSRQEDNAIKIARERYAKGEITKEELDEILDNLKHH